MRHVVLTSFSPAGWELCAKEFVRSFREFWPKQVKLICAWEGPCPDPTLSGFDLLETEPCKSFLERHRPDPVIAGKAQHPHWPWRFQRDRRKGYCWRFDAYKFARKVFAIGCAARYVTPPAKLFWIDADVVTRAHVPLDLLDSLLPENVSLCYLARPGFTSECGFVGYNLGRVETLEFIQVFEGLFADDEFVKIPEWHDSYVFDWLVKRLQPTVKQIANNDRRQPFDDSVLGNYMTHLKGARKHGLPGWGDRKRVA